MTDEFFPNPCVAVRDGSMAIAQALSIEFPDVPQINCYAHIVRAFDKHLPSAPRTAVKAEKRRISKLKAVMKHDISLLQLSRSPKHFSMACEAWYEH